MDRVLVRGEVGAFQDLQCQLSTPEQQSTNQIRTGLFFSQKSAGKNHPV